MPAFNNCDICEIPWDFRIVVSYRLYLDYVYKTIGYFPNVPEPPKFVTHQSQEFKKWCEWAKEYKPQEHKGTGQIQPFEDTDMMNIDIRQGFEGWLKYIE